MIAISAREGFELRISELAKLSQGEPNSEEVEGAVAKG
jgi:hypothetical protein